MIFFEDIPYASERMGIIWTLGTVAGACILEFGPEGSTHYAAAQHGTYNGKMSASLYTTGLTEKEVVFGDLSILEKGACELIKINRPSHLFVLPSAVSEIIGVDIDSVCQGLNQSSDTEVLGLGGISLDSDYTVGVERVLSLLAEKVVQEPTDIGIKKYNIIGSGMDCYNYKADFKEIERMMADAFGFYPQANFTGDSSMKSLKSAGEAACNIVLRKEGIPCAQILKERFGQPYCYGAPYGIAGTISWIKAVERMIHVQPLMDFLKKEVLQVKELKDRLDYHKRISRCTDASFVISGRYDLLKSCGPFIRDELQFQIKGAVLTHPVLTGETDEFMFFRDDTEKYAYISSKYPDFLLADAVTLQHFKGQIPGIQISNPNLGAIRLYSYTPFMGFRGAQVIIQELGNMLLKPT